MQVVIPPVLDLASSHLRDSQFFELLLLVLSLEVLLLKYRGVQIVLFVHFFFLRKGSLGDFHLLFLLWLRIGNVHHFYIGDGRIFVDVCLVVNHVVDIHHIVRVVGFQPIHLSVLLLQLRLSQVEYLLLLRVDHLLFLTLLALILYILDLQDIQNRIEIVKVPLQQGVHPNETHLFK